MIGTLVTFIVPYLVISMLLSSVMAFMISPTQTQFFLNRGTSSRKFDSVPNGVQDVSKSEARAISSSNAMEPRGMEYDFGASAEMEPQEKQFVLISDSTGLTVQTALSKCLSQFDWSDDECLITDEGEICKITKKILSFVRTEEAVLKIVQEAKENSAMVAFTFADPDLRASAAMLCEKTGVPFVDLMGPMLLRMTDFLKLSPMGKPAAMRVSLNADYFRRIDAVEFTLKADDGQAPWLLKDADVVIVGVSRTGKTPLSVVLSQTMGWKVGNVPLVLEVKAPEQLVNATEIDSRRVFCLTINPKELRRIRENRLQVRGIKKQEEISARFGAEISKSNYADRNYMLRDLKNARELCEAQDWTEIDVTGRAIEETAVLISEIITERF